MSRNVSANQQPRRAARDRLARCRRSPPTFFFSAREALARQKRFFDSRKARFLNCFSHASQDRILDDAYNKYARDDDEDLPEWFLEDERKFMRPPPVYDEKDLAEANERLAAVDTRSIKKVAEAKFRKKKRATTCLISRRFPRAAVFALA